MNKNVQLLVEDTMHIAICDDEAFFRRSLSEELYLYADKHGLNFIIYEYSGGIELLTTNMSFDLIFMDHQMKDKNGLDTVSVLRKRNVDTTVIFVSSYKDVVFDSMKVNAFRFLVKPFEKEDLYEALDSVMKNQANVTRIVVKDTVNQKNITIPESEIIYAQADNIYAEVVTSQGIFLYSNKITLLEKELNEAYFYRSNRSYIVNFNYITGYSKKEIEFSNGQKALISSSKFKDFKSKYLNYLKRKSIGE